METIDVLPELPQVGYETQVSLTDSTVKTLSEALARSVTNELSTSATPLQGDPLTMVLIVVITLAFRSWAAGALSSLGLRDRRTNTSPKQ